MAVPGYGLVIGAFDAGQFPDQDVDNIIQNRQPVIIDPCFTFKADSVMVQTPQGPATTYMRQCMPLANCMGGGKLLTIIESALLFNKMEKADEERHKGLVKQLLDQLAHTRMQAAGIVAAKLGDMPRGPIGQS